MVRLKMIENSENPKTVFKQLIHRSVAHLVCYHLSEAVGKITYFFQSYSFSKTITPPQSNFNAVQQFRPSRKRLETKPTVTSVNSFSSGRYFTLFPKFIHIQEQFYFIAYARVESCCFRSHPGKPSPHRSLPLSGFLGKLFSAISYLLSRSFSVPSGFFQHQPEPFFIPKQRRPMDGEGTSRRR